MLRLYGTRRSRAFRVLWMLEEVGAPYELVEVEFQDAARDAAYLAINPNGQVPALEDGDKVIVESFAINTHLAVHYGPELLPATADPFVASVEWTAWAMAELEGPHDVANRQGGEIDAERFERHLNHLRRKLVGDYLFGSEFSVVDLNLVGVLLRPQYRGIAQGHAQLGAWLERCLSRPAWQKTREEMQ